MNFSIWIQRDEVVEGAEEQSDGKNIWPFDWGKLRECEGNP